MSHPATFRVEAAYGPGPQRQDGITVAGRVIEPDARQLLPVGIGDRCNYAQFNAFSDPFQVRGDVADICLLDQHSGLLFSSIRSG